MILQHITLFYAAVQTSISMVLMGPGNLEGNRLSLTHDASRMQSHDMTFPPSLLF